MVSMIDILVAGAGPVGLTMAAELARYGLSVRIADKSPARTDKSKALVVWSRTLELLDCAGAAAAFLSAGYRVSAVNIVAGSNVVGHFTLDGVPTPHPYALMLPQSETERLLEEHLSGLGVRVERTVELTKFVEGGDRVVSTLRRADGSEETVESSWLIGCDGPHSLVRHQLGLEFHGDTLVSDWILADVNLDGGPSRMPSKSTGTRTASWQSFLSPGTAFASSPISAPPTPPREWTRRSRRCRKFSTAVGREAFAYHRLAGSRRFALMSARSCGIAWVAPSSRAMRRTFTVRPAGRE
jgi:2-polyprenyl-6-methoxyphenol hydroxylase-like FAD-dependent oxidoreductase